MGEVSVGCYGEAQGVEAIFSTPKDLKILELSLFTNVEVSGKVMKCFERATRAEKFRSQGRDFCLDNCIKFLRTNSASLLSIEMTHRRLWTDKELDDLVDRKRKTGLSCSSSELILALSGRATVVFERLQSKSTVEYVAK